MIFPFKKAPQAQIFSPPAEKIGGINFFRNKYEFGGGINFGRKTARGNLGTGAVYFLTQKHHQYLNHGQNSDFGHHMLPVNLILKVFCMLTWHQNQEQFYPSKMMFRSESACSCAGRRRHVVAPILTSHPSDPMEPSWVGRVWTRLLNTVWNPE